MDVVHLMREAIKDVVHLMRQAIKDVPVHLHALCVFGGGSCPCSCAMACAALPKAIAAA